MLRPQPPPMAIYLLRPLRCSRLQHQWRTYWAGPRYLPVIWYIDSLRRLCSLTPLKAGRGHICRTGVERLSEEFISPLPLPICRGCVAVHGVARRSPVGRRNRERWEEVRGTKRQGYGCHASGYLSVRQPYCSLLHPPFWLVGVRVVPFVSPCMCLVCVLGY